MEQSIHGKSPSSVKKGYLLLLSVIMIGSCIIAYFSISNTTIDVGGFNIYASLDEYSGSMENTATTVNTTNSITSANVDDAKEAEKKEESDDDGDDDEFDDDDKIGAAIQEELTAGKDIARNEDLVEEKLKTDAQNVQTHSDKLNILVLYPDDWRWNSIGRENTLIQTPFLDSLSDEGMRFRKNCVTSSICWLSRGKRYDIWFSVFFLLDYVSDKYTHSDFIQRSLLISAPILETEMPSFRKVG